MIIDRSRGRVNCCRLAKGIMCAVYLCCLPFLSHQGEPCFDGGVDITAGPGTDGRLASGNCLCMTW